MDHGLFQHAGYMGMYNMSLKHVSDYKGVKQANTYLIGWAKRKWPAHLFRITQTQAKIKSEDIRGQKALEKAATDVGRSVRQTMVRPPEELPLEENVRTSRRRLKAPGKLCKH